MDRTGNVIDLQENHPEKSTEDELEKSLRSRDGKWRRRRDWQEGRRGGGKGGRPGAHRQQLKCRGDVSAVGSHCARWGLNPEHHDWERGPQDIRL